MFTGVWKQENYTLYTLLAVDVLPLLSLWVLKFIFRVLRRSSSFGVHLHVIKSWFAEKWSHVMISCACYLHQILNIRPNIVHCKSFARTPQKSRHMKWTLSYAKSLFNTFFFFYWCFQFIDDDKKCHLEINYTFEIRKDWQWVRRKEYTAATILATSAAWASGQTDRQTNCCSQVEVVESL